MSKKININDIMELSEHGNFDKEITNSLYGLNAKKQMPLLENNKDYQGFTFFVRPQLNLSTTNIRNVRQYYPLLINNELSMQRFVRLTLDPRLQHDVADVLYGNEKLYSPLVDSKQAFIPILSNTLTTMSGWPDLVIPTFTSPNGLRKEQISMIDGTFEILDSFDITCTFKNFINEPLSLLFYIWSTNPSLVFEGMLMPYHDFILENEFDYNTRIYRFVMDATGKFIKKVSATGAAFPISVPTGKFFDFDNSKPYSDQTKEINITFKCMGAMYNDDILLKEFNETSAIFNPDIRQHLISNGTKSNLVKIDYNLLTMLNYRGYPIVNLDTYELEWFIDKNSLTYKKLIEDHIDLLEDEKETLEEKMIKEGMKTYNEFNTTNLV